MFQKTAAPIFRDELSEEHNSLGGAPDYQTAPAAISTADPISPLPLSSFLRSKKKKKRVHRRVGIEATIKSSNAADEGDASVLVNPASSSTRKTAETARHEDRKTVTPFSAEQVETKNGSRNYVNNKQETHQTSDKKSQLELHVTTPEQEDISDIAESNVAARPEAKPGGTWEWRPAPEEDHDSALGEEQKLEQVGATTNEWNDEVVSTRRDEDEDKKKEEHMTFWEKLKVNWMTWLFWCVPFVICLVFAGFLAKVDDDDEKTLDDELKDATRPAPVHFHNTFVDGNDSTAAPGGPPPGAAALAAAGSTATASLGRGFDLARLGGAALGAEGGPPFLGDYAVQADGIISDKDREEQRWSTRTSGGFGEEGSEAEAFIKDDDEIGIVQGDAVDDARLMSFAVGAFADDDQQKEKTGKKPMKKVVKLKNRAASPATAAVAEQHDSKNTASAGSSSTAPIVPHFRPRSSEADDRRVVLSQGSSSGNVVRASISSADSTTSTSSGKKKKILLNKQEQQAAVQQPTSIGKRSSKNSASTMSTETGISTSGGAASSTSTRAASKV
ncbi:unnamed protein product [Amoebophrya sp. A120]|nr:unnamed protein product [Amoebophrya sp. A120]|eukprot:GSA120T00007991001.1